MLCRLYKDFTMSERKLVGTQEMFKKALEGKYAIGAYNVNNMEILQAIAEAAEETRSPIILQVSAGARKYANQTYLIKLVQAALETTTVPIALHLDHGADFEICKACIDGGFSSVMIDGSRFPLEENIALTKQVVDYAHPRGVSVEAELGKLAGVEDDVKVHSKDATYTDPEDAAKFVKETGCDSLAIAIGTSHGAYKFKEEPKLDFDRLAACKKAINIASGDWSSDVCSSDL
jgi:fructose-bisphosphate aldolase class II